MANLLVVDDDADLCDACAEVLRAHGHTVRIADDGQPALARVSELMPDLIVSDIEMPVLTGPNMSYRLFLDDVGREAIPILLISGFGGIREVADEVGTPFFLAKPFTANQLVGSVARALAEGTPPRRRAV
jgi:DNA-binding NtrC family response regulator